MPIKPQARKEPYLRSRSSQTGSLVLPLSKRWHNYTSGNLTYDSGYISYSPVLLVSRKDMSDWVTPGYQQLVSDGAIVNNPMSSVHVEYISAGDSGYEFKQTQGSGSSLVEYKVTLAANAAVMHFGKLVAEPVSQSMVERVTTLAQTKCLANVGAPSLDSIAAIKEFNKTVGLFAKPLKGLNDWFLDYEKRIRAGIRDKRTAVVKGKLRVINGNRYGKKSGNKWVEPPSTKRPIESVGDFLANTVLGVNLGFRPFLMEVDALIHKIPKLEEQVILTARGDATQEVEWSETKTLTKDGLAATFRYDYKHKVQVRAMLRYKDQFEPGGHFGVRVADIPTALWEITPFSWLVDYLINVQQYLGALRGLYIRAVQAGSTSVFIESTTSRTWLSVVPPAPYTTVTRSPVGTEKTVVTVSTRDPGPFKPGLSLIPTSFTFRTPNGGPSKTSPSQNVLALLLKRLVAASREGRTATFIR